MLQELSQKLYILIVTVPIQGASHFLVLWWELGPIITLTIKPVFIPVVWPKTRKAILLLTLISVQRKVLDRIPFSCLICFVKYHFWPSPWILNFSLFSFSWWSEPLDFSNYEMGNLLLEISSWPTQLRPPKTRCKPNPLPTTGLKMASIFVRNKKLLIVRKHYDCAQSCHSVDDPFLLFGLVEFSLVDGIGFFEFVFTYSIWFLRLYCSMLSPVSNFQNWDGNNNIDIDFYLKKLSWSRWRQWRLSHTYQVVCVFSSSVSKFWSCGLCISWPAGSLLLFKRHFQNYPHLWHHDYILESNIFSL